MTDANAPIDEAMLPLKTRYGSGVDNEGCPENRTESLRR